MSDNSIISFRSHVPAACRRAYFETASTGLVPDFVYNGVRAYQDDRYRLGGDSVWDCDGRQVDTQTMLSCAADSVGRMLGAAGKTSFSGSTHLMFTAYSAAA